MVHAHRTSAAGGGVDLPRRPRRRPRAPGVVAPRVGAGGAVAVARERLLRLLPAGRRRGARADRPAPQRTGPALRRRTPRPSRPELVRRPRRLTLARPDPSDDRPADGP